MAEKQITNLKKHPLWSKFTQWVESLDYSIGMEHEEDWIENWKCFLAGAQAAIHAVHNPTRPQVEDCKADA